VEKANKRKKREAGQEHFAGQAEPEVEVGFLERDRKGRERHYSQEQALNVVQRPQNDGQGKRHGGHGICLERHRGSCGNR